MLSSSITTSTSGEKRDVYAWALLTFPSCCLSSVSPQLPSFLKFPNKSQQIDTYLSPPPLSLSCPPSGCCWTGRSLINQPEICPLVQSFSLPSSTDGIACADPPWQKKVHNSLLSPAPFLLSRNTGSTPPWCLCRGAAIGWYGVDRVCLHSTHNQVR